MAASFENLQQVQHTSTNGGERDNVLKNDFTAGDQKPNIGMDHLQANFDESQQCFSMEGHVKSEIEATEEEATKIKSNNDAETTTENKREIMNMSLDLDLNPKAPEASENPPNPMNNNKKESDENLVVGGSSGDELPSLIVMGCINCLLYVMVLKFDPECPKCKNTDLLDVVGEYYNNNNN